jgi:hypothetical protein
VAFNTEVSLLIFCPDDLSIDASGILKPPDIIVLDSINAFMSGSVCFMRLGTPIFSVYMFIIVISSYRIVPFINMKWLSLSLLTNFGLKLALSDMNINLLACFWTPFAWKIFFYPFTLHLCLFLSMWYIFWKQKIVGSCFLIQSSRLEDLIRELKPLTFSVIIERYVILLFW